MMTSKNVIEKKRKLLIEKVLEYPNLSPLVTEIISEPDETFVSTFGYLLNTDILQCINRISAVHSFVADEQPSIQPSIQPYVSQFDEANKTNRQYFAKNKPSDIADKIRTSFHKLSKDNTTTYHECMQRLNLGLSDTILYEIESFILRHDVNLIHLDMDTLRNFMLEEMEKDSEWCVKNILSKDVIDLADPNGHWINYFMKEKLYGNNENIRDSCRSKISYWENKNKKLIGDRLSFGDIFVLISDTMHSGFDECYYILDFDSKLRKIGIKQYVSHYHDLHIIIPVHRTQWLYDPILAYAPFINQHCYENAGTVEVELQIDNKSIVFHPENQTLSEKRQKSLIKDYGWNQKHYTGRVNKKAVDKVRECIVKDYNPYSYSTVYLKTDGDGLIACCNHAFVDKINLSQIPENVEKKWMGYIVNFNKEPLDKTIPSKYFTLLICGCYRQSDANNSLQFCQDAIHLIQQFYSARRRPKWELDCGLTLSNNKIKYVCRDYKVTDRHGEIDYDNLNWLNAVSSEQFSEGINELSVKIKRDNGAIDIGVIESGKVGKFNGWFEKCTDEAIFAYNTGGDIFINGVRESKSDNKLEHLSVGGSRILLQLDFRKSKLKFFWSRKSKGKLKLLKQVQISDKAKYRFFVVMCWKGDCVSASYLKK